MEAKADHDPPVESDRDHLVHSFLRAWLCCQTSLTLEEVERRSGALGRPARDAILKAGGLRAFVDSSSEVEVNAGRLVPVPVSPCETSGLPMRQLVINHMDEFSATELAALNRRLRSVRLEPKTGAVVSALQKRGQLVELRRKCEEKRAALEQRKRELADQEESTRTGVTDGQVEESVQKKVQYLARRRDELRARVAEGNRVLKQERKLRQEMARVDSRIETTEDQAERLKLRSTMIQEHLVSLRQDLFYESRQHEAEVEQLLAQLSADGERTIRILSLIAREKLAHSRAVLELHVSAVKDLLQTRTSSSQEPGNIVDDLAKSLAEYEAKLEELDKVEERWRLRGIDPSQVSRLPLVRIRDLQRSPPVDGRRPLIFPSLVEDVFFEELVPEQGVNKGADTGEDPESEKASGCSTETCLICLHQLDDEGTDTLACSHRFHGTCLQEMRSFGLSTCPLCRCYDPSPQDFPSLTDS